MSAPGAPSRANPLLNGPIFPTLARMSASNAVAMLATAAVAIAETSYVSVLGIAPLAAMALVFPMVMLQGMMSTGAMGGGVSSAISRALGAKDIDRAQALARHATCIGLLGGVVFLLIFELFGGPIFRLLGGKGAALEQALVYSQVVFLGAIPVWLVNTWASIIRGGGNMKVPSLTLLGLALLQVVLGGGFGLGLGPFPRLGIAGVALGQVLANLLAAIFLYWFLSAGKARVRLRLRGEPLNRAMFYDILKVGALACISPLQSVLTVLIITSLVARYGIEALAGYGIGSRLEFLLVPITFAVGAACVPLVGMAIGAGKVERARSVAWTGGVLSGGLLGSIGLFFALWPEAWVTHFTTDPTAASMARDYLVWAGPCYGMFGLGLCLYFASMGSGKILGPVLAATVRLLVVAVGGAALVYWEAPTWAMFAMVGASMCAYGLATAYAVWKTPWA
jgi:putative MATE family efflux protein